MEEKDSHKEEDENIGEALRFLRHQAYMTQEEVVEAAEEAGDKISKIYYSEIERPTTSKKPSPEKLDVILKALGKDKAELENALETKPWETNRRSSSFRLRKPRMKKSALDDLTESTNHVSAQNALPEIVDQSLNIAAKKQRMFAAPSSSFETQALGFSPAPLAAPFEAPLDEQADAQADAVFGTFSDEVVEQQELAAGSASRQVVPNNPHLNYVVENFSNLTEDEQAYVKQTMEFFLRRSTRDV